MIESPKNFIEQFQNFIEHIAGVMNGLVSSKKAQTFTDGEKKQARDNIEAVSLNDLSNQFNSKINLTGDRGQLAGYEATRQESSNTIIINENSPDCIVMTSAGNKTINVNSTAYSNAFCIKYVCCYVSSGTVTVNGLAGTFGGDPLEFGSAGWAIALVKSGGNTWEGIPIGKW